MNTRELTEDLNRHLPDELFEELCRYLDEGDTSDLYECMAEIDERRHPEHYSMEIFKKEIEMQ